MLDGHREMQRDTWFRLRCFVVPRAHEEQIVNSLKNQLHLDGRSLPDMEVHFQYYLGEYPWHPDIVGLEQQQWFLAPDSPLAPVYPAVATYTREKSGYDYSIDRTIPDRTTRTMARRPNGAANEELDTHPFSSIPADGPSSWIRRFSNRDPPRHLSIGTRSFSLSSSAISRRSGSLRARRAPMAEPSAGMGFGGRLNHTAIYRLESDGFSRCYHQEWDDPDQEQLETMFRPDKVPAGVTTKTRS